MYNWLDEDKYNKLKFQMRGQFAAILNVFNCYGMNNDVATAIEECMKITENSWKVIRGKDKPVHILSELKRRATE